MAADGVISADEIGGLFFIQSYMMTLDAYSTLESSPWTSENFGADPIKARSAKQYLAHAVANSMLVAAMGAIIAKSRRAWWGVVAAAVANVYLIWLYLRALAKGAAAGSAGWANGT
jgi:hypothetical protein